MKKFQPLHVLDIDWPWQTSRPGDVEGFHHVDGREERCKDLHQRGKLPIQFFARDCQAGLFVKGPCRWETFDLSAGKAKVYICFIECLKPSRAPHEPDELWNVEYELMKEVYPDG